MGAVPEGEQLDCESCGTGNPPGAKFCMGCGSALTQRCASCTEPIPGEARFCPSCGTPVAGATAPPPARRTSPDPQPEERRRVSIVFADLSGFTAASERMDPEAIKSQVERCLRRLAAEITAHGGVVDKYIGDSVMGLLGAPVTHEDDEERAVRAALAMQDAMPQINAELGTDFALRVGVNTGEVIAGAVGDSYTVIGDPVNVAARLQAAGRPGSVTVGEQTWAATRDAVEYVPLDPLTLKGKSEPVPAWEAVRTLASRPARARASKRAPLIGRSQELGLLRSQFERVAREGRPHLATVVGEAGVGKSRLLAELVTALETDENPPTVRVGHCLPYGAGVVYWALGEVVRAECGISDADDAETAWRKLLTTAERLLGAGVDAAEDESAERRAMLIAHLLGLDTTGIDTTLEGDPERLREASFSAIRVFVEAMAKERPLLLIIEDIHWADSGLLDLIEFLAGWARGPVMLLCLAREELLDRRSQWGGGRLNASTIVLRPLAGAEADDLVDALLAGSGVEASMVSAISRRSGGNPFFAEEIVRGLGETGSADASLLPDSIQGVLAARLDSLDPLERQVVQHAAVVGTSFWLGSLTGVASAPDLERILHGLQEKDLLITGDVRARLAGEAEYAFKHVLIRDVAYAQLPKAVRCSRHREVAEFIEDRAGDRREEVTNLLAEHRERAAVLGAEVGLPAAELEPIRAQAVEALETAGDTAAGVFSNQEALARYEAALRVAGDDRKSPLAIKCGDMSMRMGRVGEAISLWEPALADALESDQAADAAGLHRRLGAAFWEKGETRAAIEHYQHGINLLKDRPPDLALVALYEEAATLYMNTGDNMLAIYAAEKALRVAEGLSETRAAARAHGIFGRIFGRIGDLARAHENLDRSVALAREADPGETARALLALGSHLETAEADGEAAAAAYSEALEIAQRLGDAPAQVELQAALGVLAAYRADWPGVELHADASFAIAEREGLAGKLAYPHTLRGFLRWRAGELDAAKREFGRAHELAEKIGWSEVAFWALFGLSLCRRDSGDSRGAYQALDRALEVCERAGLAVQAIQTLAMRAVTLALEGRGAEGRGAADEASRRAEGMSYPIATAAVLEACGATASDPSEGISQLREAHEKWTEVGRPLDAARCLAAIAYLAGAGGEADAEAAMEEAQERYRELGVDRGLEPISIALANRP